MMTTTRTGSKSLLRDLNRSIVLNLIAERGPLSRTELARAGGLPAATITRIVGDFVDAGLVAEMTAASSGGRRPVLLSINPTAGHVLGVKLREDSLTVALCDLSCAVVHQCDTAFPVDAAPYRALEVIADAVERCVAEAGVARRAVLGVGVGLSGLIDAARGLCRYSAILGWRDVEIGPVLEYKLRLPVRVDNDVNTLAVAERQFGTERGVANLLVVTVGRGVGMGIVVEGEIYRGAGGAGEVGHMTVDTTPDAPLCTCGKRGCLEAVAADYGIVRAAQGDDPGHAVEAALDTLIARAEAGDEAVRAIFACAGAALGVALANLANLFDPDLIVLGGEGLRAGALLTDPLRAALPRHLFGRSAAEVALVIRPTDEATWARGAASLVLRELFRPPIYETEVPLFVDDLLDRAHGARRQRWGAR